MIIMYVFYIKVKICHGLCLRWMIEVASKCNCLMKTSILILAQDCLKLSLDVQYCRCIGLAACLYSGFSILRRQRIFGNRLFFFSRKMSVSTKLYEKSYGFTQKILHLGRIYSELQQTLPHPSLANSMRDCRTSAGNYGKQRFDFKTRHGGNEVSIEPGSRG